MPTSMAPNDIPSVTAISTRVRTPGTAIALRLDAVRGAPRMARGWGASAYALVARMKITAAPIRPCLGSDAPTTDTSSTGPNMKASSCRPASSASTLCRWAESSILPHSALAAAATGGCMKPANAARAAMRGTGVCSFTSATAVSAAAHSSALALSTFVCPLVSTSRPSTGAPTAMPIAEAAAIAPPSAYECPSARACSTKRTPTAASGNRAASEALNSRSSPGERSTAPMGMRGVSVVSALMRPTMLARRPVPRRTALGPRHSVGAPPIEVARLATLAALAVPAVAAAEDSPTALVNPFIGTQNFGNTFPGASMPFGMVQVSPDNGGQGGYDYKRDYIHGFSQTHLSGVGCGVVGELPVMPTTGAVGTTDQNGYRSTFSHGNEAAEPGYYRVHLDRYDV